MSLAKILINSISEMEDDERRSELKSLLGSGYNSFINRLKSGATDVKTVAALKSGLEDRSYSDDKLTISNLNIKVTALKPCQNEIDMTQSLFYPLTDITTATNCLRGSGVVIKEPIIIFKGKYVIDGHHRWSQVFAVNSNATVLAENLGMPTSDPMKVLAGVQMAIAAKSGTVPTSTVSGTNLFSVSKSALVSFVLGHIKPEIVSVFSQFNRGSNPGEIANYIWSNIEVMRSTSKPISGAPPRGLMPQTDQAPGWDRTMATGVVNWNDPL